MYIFLQLTLQNATTDRHPRKEVKGKVKLSDIKEKIEDKMLATDPSKVALAALIATLVVIVSLVAAVLGLYLRSKYGTV